MPLNPTLFIRNRYHPLFYLRKYPAFQKLTRLMDIPVAIRFPEVSHRVCVSLSKNLSWVLSGGKAGEEDERRNFAALLRAGRFRTFVDVGANVGLYGFMFRSLVPDPSVIMIEPDSDNAELIRKTLRRAGASNVTLVEAAASDTTGTLTFFRDTLTGATGSLNGEEPFVSVHHACRPSEVTVKSVRIDDLCAHQSP